MIFCGEAMSIVEERGRLNLGAEALEKGKFYFWAK